MLKICCSLYTNNYIEEKKIIKNIYSNNDAKIPSKYRASLIKKVEVLISEDYKLQQKEIQHKK